MSKYTIEAYASDGSVYTRTATSYRDARSQASGLRRGLWNKVIIIEGDDIEYHRYGHPINIRDAWKVDGRRWYRTALI